MSIEKTENESRTHHITDARRLELSKWLMSLKAVSDDKKDTTESQGRTLSDIQEQKSINLELEPILFPKLDICKKTEIDTEAGNPVERITEELTAKNSLNSLIYNLHHYTVAKNISMPKAIVRYTKRTERITKRYFSNIPKQISDEKNSTPDSNATDKPENYAFEPSDNLKSVYRKLGNKPHITPLKITERTKTDIKLSDIKPLMICPPVDTSFNSFLVEDILNLFSEVTDDMSLPTISEAISIDSVYKYTPKKSETEHNICDIVAPKCTYKKKAFKTTSIKTPKITLRKNVSLEVSACQLKDSSKITTTVIIPSCKEISCSQAKTSTEFKIDINIPSCETDMSDIIKKINNSKK